MKRKYFRWIKITLLIYALLGIALYYLQDRILIHPKIVGKNENYNLPYTYREMNIPYDQATNINIVQFYTKDDTIKNGVILYFHGNRENISWYARHSVNFTKRHYEVWMMDYPGFGKSTGTFSEQKLYAYALQVYKLARTRYGTGNIVIYGKSMGTGIAAQLASVRDCKYLLLETPYFSMTSLAAHYFPIYPVSRLIHYKFPTNEYLKEVTAPVIIFHGGSDGVIPFDQSRRLAEGFKQGDQLIRIENGSHNNLTDFPIYQRELDSLFLR